MSQYKSILKATSIFGGTQILQILINLIRTKFVALLIGSAGMGLSAMLTSSLAIVITIFGMGINTSVIRDLSKANDEGDDYKYSIVIKVFNRMLFALSLMGAIFVLLSSPFFSDWSFGNHTHTVDYCFLSLYVMFTLLSQGNTARLIGRRMIKETALCSLIGAIVSLLTSVPFFYFWRLDGIVPGIIVSTIAHYLITLYFARKVHLQDVQVELNDIKMYGKTIFILGSSLVIAVLVGNITIYGINICIRNMGDINDIGFYNAGMSMTGQAVSMIFSAMSSDYYPRLVASLKDVKLMNETINQQTEIVIHLSAPILAVFSILSPLIIRVLFSEEFLVINGFIRIICFGMLMKAIAYSLGNVSFAKGDKTIYMLLEGGYGNLMNFVTSVGFYYIWGLKGLAYGFAISGIVYFVIIYLVDHFRYKYTCSCSAIRVIATNVPLLFCMMVADWLFESYSYYIIAILLASIIIPYNFYYLNKKSGIITMFLYRLKVLN